MDLLETPRLILRRWTERDAELLAALGALPEVVRYVGTGQVWTPQRAAEVSARNVEHWRAHGFGWRVVEAQARPLGLIALNYAGEGTVGLDPSEFEIGWWLHPEAWGRGYATEGARAVRDEALTRVHAPSLVARIQPANAASRRVAEGLGMRVDFDTVDRHGVPVLVYRL